MMERNHGHIVSVASIAGLVGAYQLTDYCASKFAAVGLEESLRLELNCDGYDGIHSTVVCPYYINTGMFSGIGRSLIPVLTPEYVVNETVKAVLVNQEMVCLPDIVYWIYALRSVMPTRSFLWYHRAIGAASTMKTFIGRNGAPQHMSADANKRNGNHNNNNVNLNNNLMKSALASQHVTIKMKPDSTAVDIPTTDANEVHR
jgi:NAD(P)-dependent dehydrogenase (short-subunit alcohol dehydrogenase family)